VARNLGFRTHRLGDGKIAVEVVGETSGTILQLTADEFAAAVASAAKGRQTKKRVADIKRLIEEE
jgi:hypothetical protein